MRKIISHGRKQTRVSSFILVEEGRAQVGELFMSFPCLKRPCRTCGIRAGNEVGGCWDSKVSSIKFISSEGIGTISFSILPIKHTIHLTSYNHGRQAIFKD